MFQAAVRSSRRKRNQYVVDLRHHVDDLRKRRNDLEVEHSLLEQLTSLWERLCKEVESEIQDGVKQQLGFQVAGPTSPSSPSSQISPASNPAASDQLSEHPKPTPVIVLQRTDKTSYPNTRGKRKIDETTSRPTRGGKRRLLVEEFDRQSSLLVSGEDVVHISRSFDEESSSGLLLQDEVVPQSPCSLSKRSSRCCRSSSSAVLDLNIKNESDL